MTSKSVHTLAAMQFSIFATELGWMAIVGRGRKLYQVVSGHPTRQAALAALSTRVRTSGEEADWWPELVQRLEDYARGVPTDFRDVQIDLDHLTAFQRRVVRACRALDYGQTASYGQIAKASGSAGAARAVGTTMAHNRYPLIVPCHRVTRAGGVMGSYSGPQGVKMKTRLLVLEQADTDDRRKPRTMGRAKRSKASPRPR